ncbi:putative holin family protein [Fusobacterium phage vB_FnuS_FNU4]|nr:putative holin family protein [Fusobacterium phage vB_FnuS_FNU4]
MIIMDATLLQYGAIGAMLIYFIWKDKSTFEMYKNTMQRMADLLEAIQKEQSELKKDVEEIKKFIK